MIMLEGHSIFKPDFIILAVNPFTSKVPVYPYGISISIFHEFIKLFMQLQTNV